VRRSRRGVKTAIHALSLINTARARYCP
jgi:hypothetical protein